ncbi:multicopper oxidase domain-containing protein [Dactylosporangium sp. CA-139066]|uniref:multicopper oxidase domain-containing protein n=1 Tax=Dactylosporangium sp. CA-139066 TaxID=3239930 RepID=UPI003D8A5C33
MNLRTALRGTAFATTAALLLSTPAHAALPGGVSPGRFAGRPASGPILAPPPAGISARGPAQAPAPPQGPLPLSGCTVVATAATCELWAKAGQLVLPGAAAPVPIWGFSSTVDGPAGTPGPALVVDQGTTVTVRVHNGLSRNLSLALPAVTGLAPDPVGAAPGATAAYTFTARRPGTYLYEAGHTADGARQTAMGLVGALVVRGQPVDGRPTAYGDVASAFADEALLVLGDLDPALNTSADPYSFDLRKYAPKYRMINGKSFPETDAIATDVGRRVLLRYVDAGVMSHAMSVLGLDQSLVGQDSRPNAYPEGTVTVPLQPGQTADALVSIPAGPDGRRFMVFETGGQLNNNGQRYGPAQAGVSPVQAFGGMLTFLDTNPAPISGDHVGPTVSRVVAAPDPAGVTAPVTVTADFSDVANGGSTVDAAEVVVDDLSIGEGTGIAFTSAAFGTASVVTGATATIDTAVLTTLTQGRHTLWVRARDSAGNWGVVNSTTVNLAVTGAVTTAVSVSPNPTSSTATLALSATGDDRALGGTVVAAEYSIDAAAGNGAGTAMTLAQPGAAISAETATIPAEVAGALTEGRHTVYVHTKDSLGLWGPMGSTELVVDRTAPALLQGAVLPASTNGTVGSPSDPGDLRVNAAFTDPVSAGVASPIAGAEGFIDTAGTNGSGFVFFALDGAFSTPTENTYGLVPLSELTGLSDGQHTILVHARDAAGNWGPLTAVTFTVDRAGPTITAAAPSANPVTTQSFTLNATASDAFSQIVAGEWFEGADPGAGNAAAMTVTGTGATTAALAATVTGLANGAHTLRVRAKDAAGNWGSAVTVAVTVNVSTLIFADGFDSGTANAWSSRVGPVAVARSAAMGNSYALTLTGSTPAYVVDQSPAAERAMHAQFTLAVGTFNTRGGTVDLYQLRNAAGQAVATVQYRRTNAGASQLRTGVLTSAGWQYSAWTGIGTGAITVKLDWTSAAAGGVALTVNGTRIGSITGNTSGSTVESAALGLVATTGTNTGTGAVDSYTVNR